MPHGGNTQLGKYLTNACVEVGGVVIGTFGRALGFNCALNMHGVDVFYIFIGKAATN